MMVNLSLLIVVIFAVLEIRTEDGPGSPEEQLELAKRFSEIELKRARDAGLSDLSILLATSNGWTLEEMIRMMSFTQEHKNASIRQFCDVVFPTENATITPTPLTSAQELNLINLYQVSHTAFVRHSEQRPFLQSFICAYSSQPDTFDAAANSFGSKFVLYMKIQFMKTKVPNAWGVGRIRLVKEICCLYEGKKDKIIGYIDEYDKTGLSDEDLDDFNNRWDAFVSANTSKKLEIVCDFLHAKIPFKECPEYVYS